MDPDFPFLDENSEFEFPPVASATREGLVAVGGNLSPGMLLSAYRQGIFPWYAEGEPLLWFSPDPRFVLFAGELHVPKSLAKSARRGLFEVRFDTAFDEVIAACRDAPRPGQNGTWITGDIIDGYRLLHRLGYAHSIEAYRDGRLAGGLYGISLGSIFFGESMFARAPDASKVAFVRLEEVLTSRGFTLTDCQVYSSHLERFGARSIPRREYLALLRKGLEAPTLQGNWTTIGA